MVWNSTSLFVDSISYVNKSAASSTWCNNILPLRLNSPRGWYCRYPVIWDCTTPRDLLVEAVRIDDEDLLDLSLGRSRSKWRSS
jgi:hypothetical protein